MADQIGENIVAIAEIYESVTDRSILSGITAGLKNAGFEGGTSYIATSNGSPEILVQITRFRGKRVENTGYIQLEKGTDFTQNQGVTSITSSGIAKMRTNYEAIRNITSLINKVLAETEESLDDLSATLSA